MKRKLKNAIILTITAVMFVLWVLSVLSVDSTTNIPIFTLIISTTWLFYFMWANDMLE